MSTSLTTKITDWRRLYATNATATSFTTRTDTATKPSGDGVLDLAGLGAESPNTVAIQIYGVGADNATALFRAYGVSAVTENGLITSWHFTPLFSGQATLNTALPGVSGAPVSNANYYADTLTRTVGVENVGDSLISPGDNTGAATLLLDMKGSQLLFVEVHTNSSATSVNAIARGV